MANFSFATLQPQQGESDYALQARVADLLAKLYRAMGADAAMGLTTLLASAARTANTAAAVSAVQTGIGLIRSVLLVLNVTAASGTGGLQVSLQNGSPLFNLTGGGTAVTATGIYTYWYGAGAPITAGSGFRNAQPVPLGGGDFNAFVLVGDATTYTYSLSAYLFPW